jgi:hypothetical protein
MKKAQEARAKAIARKKEIHDKQNQEREQRMKEDTAVSKIQSAVRGAQKRTRIAKKTQAKDLLDSVYGRAALNAYEIQKIYPNCRICLSWIRLLFDGKKGSQTI